MKNFNTLLTLSELKEHYGGPPVGICTLYNGKLDKAVVESKTGNPIVLPPYKAITSLNISFSPQQAGSGDPSPENVRPIAGWDEVTVNVRGKNLFNISKIESTRQITNNGDGSLTISPGDGTILAVTGKTLRELCDGITPGTYTLNAKTTAPNKIVYTPVIGVWTFGTSKTLTDEMLDSILYLYASGLDKIATMSNIQLELGSTPTPYEPYQPSTAATLTLPETIYGGTVDGVTGVGSKTWGYIASYNGEALPGEWISDRDVYVSGTTPATGAQVAYKLATPEPVKVNPISIPSRIGINIIYSDADNLSCDFKISSFWGDAD